MFDSIKNISWQGSGFVLNNKNVLLKSSGYIKQSVNLIPGAYKLSLLGKGNLSGSTLSIQIISDDLEFILNEEVSFSKTLSEKILFFNVKKNFKGIVKVIKKQGGVGAFEINRLLIYLKPSEKTSPMVKNIKIKENITPHKSLGILIPYEIYGGAEVYIKTLLESINTNDIDVHLLYIKENPIKLMINDDNIKHKLLSSKENLSNYIKTFNIKNICIYNSIKAYKYALSAKMENKNIKIYEIYHSNFKWPDSLSNLKTREGVDLIFRTSDGYLNDFSNKLVDLPVPLNLDLFNYNLPKSLNINNANKVIGTVARLSQEKNISYIFSLSKEMTDYNFVIFGDGPLHNGLAKIIKENNIKNIFLMGHKKDVHLYYKNFDYFLLPSLFEGTPISILEAMASEVPVFTNDVGEIKRLLNDRVEYLTLNAKKDSAMIKDFVINKDKILENKKYIEGRHSAKIIAKDFVDAIFIESKEIKHNNNIYLPGYYI